MGNNSSQKFRNMESAAANILKRAVQMDTEKQYTMALVLYQEGVQILLNSIKEMKDVKKIDHYKEKAEQYLERAEYLKNLIETRKTSGTYRELTKIPNGGIGHGYATVFGRFLDREVTSIRIEDPYIRAAHQCQNLVRLCELAVKQCPALSKVSLVTTREPENKGEQRTRLNDLKSSLDSRLISFDYTFSETLHDRQITLSNGWIIKIGRGLDYFKAPKSMYVLGAHDLELRTCLETTVDIFHQSTVRGEGS